MNTMYKTPQRESLGGTIGGALGNILGAYAGGTFRATMESRKQSKLQQALNKFMTSEEYQNMPLTQKIAVTGARFGPEAAKAVVEGEKIEQQRQQQQQKQQLQQQGLLPENIDERAAMIQEYTGMDAEEAKKAAKYYSGLTTGGKTDFTKLLNERMQRRMFKSDSAAKGDDMGLVKQQGDQRQLPLKNLDEVTKQETNTFNWPDFRDNFQNLKESEKVRRQNQYRKENLPIYKASDKKLQTSTADLLRTNTLTTLNERGNLPEGLGRWKVHPQTGKLILPAGANKDTQYFTKILNDFTRGIKDRFGARITTFEIEVFLRSLPSLANTQEGRGLILKHMEIMTKMEKLHESSLKEVYRKYGMQNIDPAQADQAAEELSGIKMDALKQQFSQIVEEKNSILQQREEKALVEIDGKRGYVPYFQLEEARKRGAKLITDES